MAKIDARRVAAFLAAPGAVRVVLLHGDDAGLVHERANALQSVIVADADPFRLTDMPRELAVKPGALVAEATALSMTGGRRLVRVRDATDALAAPLKEVLAAKAESLVLVEGGELPARSKLRTLLEPSPDAAVVACYRERGAELAATIAQMLKEEGVTAERSACEWLAGRLGEDRMQLRREVEKIALYVGQGGHVGEEEVLACIGDGSAMEIDEALIAATTGDIQLADRALESALSEGASPIAVLRNALRHMQRLHWAACAVAAGDTPAGAMESLRPPVFFKQKAAFERALRLWSPATLEAAGAMLLEAEKRSKSSSSARPVPDGAVLRQAMMAIARQAAMSKRR
ncbi:DNA polymerase III subunit delta [Acetobacteraceae bacterium H6797]|nr:DNA polymerase III subunit delta [Acetobacteraceae bacterium H6797]